MKIKRGRVVAVEYIMRGDAEEVLQQTGKEPMLYLHGHKNIVPGLEKALEGLESGASFEVIVSVEEGYGAHSEKLLFNVPFGELPDNVQPMKGVIMPMRFGNRSRTVRITKVRLKDVQVDANHALVDKVLHFAGRVGKVREASKTEIAHGHVHSGGHAH